MDVNALWQNTLPLLKDHPEVTPVVYDTFFATLTPVSFEDGVLTLRATTNFYKTRVQSRHFNKLLNLARIASGIDDLDINITSLDDKDGQPSQAGADYAKTNLRQKYVFETFVKGKCNELAYSAAIAVAESPTSSPYNPLFLYGGVGLGKTHLVHSIGNRALDVVPELKVMYVSCDTFTNEFIHALREDTADQFKTKYRNVDVLLIDDIQFLEGRPGTQEELFHTFNDLYSANKLIVLTSDLPPKDLVGIEARLTSRFAAGLSADITIPDYETRAAILDKKLLNEKIEIPQNVKEFIIRNIVSNIRDLEGAVNKVVAWAIINKATLSLDIAQQALKDQLVNAEKVDITMDYIQQVVAAHFKLTTADLNGRKRTQSIVFPRQIAMYLCRKIMDKSLPEVGNFFGGRDHSTVIHSCEKIAHEIETDEKLRLLVDELEIRIRGE